MNKTPPNNIAVTASAPKLPKIFFGGVILLLILAVAARLLVTHGEPEPSAMAVGSQTYKIEIADTKVEQVKGLSGRESLDEDQGMLFIFGQNETHCFWMKDTNFNLDMIWFNAQLSVTHIYENVSPATYPQSFCSGNDGRYGVELPAGSVQKNGLQVGDYIDPFGLLK